MMRSLLLILCLCSVAMAQDRAPNYTVRANSAAGQKMQATNRTAQEQRDAETYQLLLHNATPAQKERISAINKRFAPKLAALRKQLADVERDQKDQTLKVLMAK